MEQNCAISPFFVEAMLFHWRQPHTMIAVRSKANHMCGERFLPLPYMENSFYGASFQTNTSFKAKKLLLTKIYGTSIDE